MCPVPSRPRRLGLLLEALGSPARARAGAAPLLCLSLARCGLRGPALGPLLAFVRGAGGGALRELDLSVNGFGRTRRGAPSRGSSPAPPPSPASACAPAASAGPSPASPPRPSPPTPALPPSISGAPAPPPPHASTPPARLTPCTCPRSGNQLEDDGV
eukprot:tig00000808_g4427.t1